MVKYQLMMWEGYGENSEGMGPHFMVVIIAETLFQRGHVQNLLDLGRIQVLLDSDLFLKGKL